MRVLDSAARNAVVLRAVGGLAVFLRCPAAHLPPLARDYKDIDLVGRAGDAQRISSLLTDIGYLADEEFNALHGHQRLYFWDPAHERQLDVFIDRITMCHELVTKDRLELDEQTLSVADLLLTKLQVVEINEKDLKDATALLADHGISKSGIDPERIVSLLSSDWGWWRTSTENLSRLSGYASDLHVDDLAARVEEHVRTLQDAIATAPKSLKWKLRASVGEKVRWYELPEEIEG